jgi:hypothetical protein
MSFDTAGMHMGLTWLGHFPCVVERLWTCFPTVGFLGHGSGFVSHKLNFNVLNIQTTLRLSFTVAVLLVFHTLVSTMLISLKRFTLPLALQPILLGLNIFS